MTTTRTPLVDPGGYFGRADAFSLRRAVGPVLAYWLGSLAVDLLWWLAGESVADPVTLLSALQHLEATLLYWIVPTIVLYGLVLAALATLGVDPGAVPSDPDRWLLVPLSLLACGWAASVWRGGLHRGFDLERATATATALLAAGVCAALLLFPVVAGAV